MANCYYASGRINEALKLFQETLEARERVHGIDHPDTLRTRSSLANCYLRVGRIAEAVQMHRTTLADRERVLGPEHPRTYTSRRRLAASLRASERLGIGNLGGTP